jgi:hypothetical protein
MIIQLQFSEIMGCANLFQRLLTVAVYCISTPSILLTVPFSQSRDYVEGCCTDKDCSFYPNPFTNMATTGNSCFWLADF